MECDGVTVRELFHELDLKRTHYDKVLHGQFRREFMLRNEGEGDGASQDLATLLVDSNGDAIPVHTSMLLWPTACTHTGELLCVSLGRRVAIKEPYVEISSDGMYVIRVLNPADVFLLDGHSPANATDATRMEDLQRIRLEGNHFFVKENWAVAVERYSQCIAEADDCGTVSQEDLNSVLLLAYTNRAEARLRLHHYEHALSDADEVLKINPNHVKSLVRKGKAEHGLGLFRESCKAFKVALAHSPEDQPITKCLMASTTSLEQSSTGKFELHEYVGRGCSGGVRSYADFVGPVEIRRVSYLNGGRGLFATRNVEAGELLLVNNALACVAEDQNWHQKLLVKLAKRVTTSKRQMAQLYSLVRYGQQVIPVPSMELFRPGSRWFPPGSENLEFDVGVILDVLGLNACTIADDTLGAGNCESPSIAGVWGIASFANHSCTPNIFHFAIGDAIFFRACVDVKKGEELTTTYLDGIGLLKDVEQRQANLREGWVFTCKCARCVLEESLRPQLWKIRVKFDELVLAKSKMSYKFQLWPGIEQLANFGAKNELVRSAKDLARIADRVEDAIESNNSKLTPKEKDWIRVTFLPAFEARVILAMEKGNTQSTISALKLVFDSTTTVWVNFTAVKDAFYLLEEVEESYSTESEAYRLTHDRVLAIFTGVFGKVATGNIPKLVNLCMSNLNISDMGR